MPSLSEMGVNVPDKAVKKYIWVDFKGRQDPVGYGVILQKEEFAGTRRVSFTTEVVAYDESMGIIETINTIYIPA